MMATLVWLLLKPNREGGQQKKHAVKFERIENIDAIQDRGNIRELVKHWYCDGIIVDEDDLNSNNWTKELFGTSRTTTKAGTVLSMKKRFTKAHESFFNTYVTDELALLED